MIALQDKREAVTYSPGQRFQHKIAATWRKWKMGAQLFAQNRMARLGMTIIFIFALMALIHPILLGTVLPRGIYHPETGYDQSVAPWPTGPSITHPLGVDALGRDILSMLMAGTRPTFAVAISAAVATAVLGILIAAISAYFRGPVDAILYNFSSALYLLPAPVLIAIIGARFYSEINAVHFGLIYGVLVGGGSAAIVLRSHALTLMNRSYIDASRVAGAGPWYIITKHLIPHMSTLAIAHMMFAVVGVVVADGFIAFFGLRQVRLNWGAMVYNSIQFLAINTKIPWLEIIAPTVALSLFAAAFYMISRGLQDVADPRLAARQVTVPNLKQFPRRRAATAPPPVSGGPEAQLALGDFGPEVSQTAFQSPPTPVTLLYINLFSQFQSALTTVGEPDGNQDLLSTLLPSIARYGGQAIRLRDGSLVVVYGLPPQRKPAHVCALLAAYAGLDLLEQIEEINRQRSVQGSPPLKLGVGIASASLTGKPEDSEQAEELKRLARTARTLQKFTGALEDGGMLIGEKTYKDLASAREQFKFGRSGPANLPGEEGQCTIYQVVGRS